MGVGRRALHAGGGTQEVVDRGDRCRDGGRVPNGAGRPDTHGAAVGRCGCHGRCFVAHAGRPRGRVGRGLGLDLRAGALAAGRWRCDVPGVAATSVSTSASSSRAWSRTSTTSTATTTAAVAVGGVTSGVAAVVALLLLLVLCLLLLPTLCATILEPNLRGQDKGTRVSKLDSVRSKS